MAAPRLIADGLWEISLGAVNVFLIDDGEMTLIDTGADVFDRVGAIDTWVESGKAPASIVAGRATNGSVDRTRRLCPYPQVAAYDKKGDSNRAESFSCRSR